MSRQRRTAWVSISWHVAGVLLALIPGAMTAYLAFRTGGYYAEAYSSVVVVLAIALGGAALASRRPFGGLGPTLVVACGALVLLVTWTWFSSGWSDAPFRALLESQRTALYLLTLLFFGSFVRRQGALSLATAGVAIAMAGVCAAALATRLYPDVFSTSSTLSPQRLSFPISYWNALGLFAGIGLILLLHLASDLRTHPAIRVLGAAARPGRRGHDLLHVFSRRCGRHRPGPRGLPDRRAIVGNGRRSAGGSAGHRARAG